MYFKIDALKSFANFTGEIHVLKSLFKKTSGPQTCKFVKKGSNTGIFLWNWQDFQALFLQNTSGGWFLK